METSLEWSGATEDLRHAVRDWAITRVRPLAREADRLHRVPDGAEAALGACPVDIARIGTRKDATDAEIAAVRADGANVVSGLLYEELCYGDCWPIFTVRGGGIGPNVVRLMGTKDQKDRWVGGVIRGEMSYGAFALTEPHFGSDVSQVATTATRDGDVWRLNGTKMYCSMGASADYVVVFATVDKSAGRHGIRAFIVERKTPGFTIAKRNEEKLGIRSAETSELLFEGAAVPLDHCLGWDGAGEKAADEGERRTTSGFVGAVGTLASSRPFMAAMSLGLARAAKQVAGDWVREHRDAFTARRFDRVADEFERMEEALLRGRRMILLSSWMKDRNLPNTREASAAKAFGPPIAERVIRRCMEFMGCDGVSEEYLVEKWYRDIKIFDIFEGSGQIQRITVSRQLMGTNAARA